MSSLIARRPPADRRRPGGQRACRLRGIPGAPDQGEGPWHLLPKGPVVCSSESPARVRAYHGPLGQRLVVQGGSAPAALHPDPHPVARRGAGGLPHHHRRVHRGRPPAAAALAVPGAGRHAGQRGGRRRHRAGFRVAARRVARRWTPREYPWTLDNPAYGWFGLSVGGPGPGFGHRRARGVGGRGGVADRDDVGTAGPRADGRAGPRRCHGHLQRRRQAALRPPRRRLESARRAHRAGRARSQRLHQGRAGRSGSGVHRRTRTAAGHDRAGPGCGCRPRRRWPRHGCPVPTCAGRGPCRCW